MKTVYICDLIGPALDWAVADCEGALAPLGNLHRIGIRKIIAGDAAGEFANDAPFAGQEKRIVVFTGILLCQGKERNKKAG